MDADYLIVGAGPAGLSLACFLAQHGLKAIMISNSSGTADTPRAHLVNPFALECLRDIGLEDDAMRMGVKHDGVQYFRWCRSVLGEEYGKVQMWGSGPELKGITEAATPCEFIDLPQSYLEPVMLRYATTNGITVRYDTELLAFERKETGITATVKDRVFGNTHEIRTRFIFGADGGRSTVARSAGFEFLKVPVQGVACNVVFEYDLTDRMHNRGAQINMVTKPDAKSLLGRGVAMRQIRPWKLWMFIAVSPATSEDPYSKYTPESPEVIEAIKEAIGADDIDIKVLRLSSWFVRNNVAASFSSGGDIFILGDAAHRHPPAFGLGSNTCIQDGYNLAWKLAYVARGLAGPALLDSYNAERQPVGEQLVREANYEMDKHFGVWKSLGMFEPDPAEGKRLVDLLSTPGEEGEAQRASLHASLEGKRNEGESVGLCMNQWYDSSAIYLGDEGPHPPFEGNRIRDVHISTFPGNRLPHVWLSKGNAATTQLSTHDLAGHTAFTLLVGHGGDGWKDAAKTISKQTGIPINVYSIGYGLEYHDKYRDWVMKREVSEDGCILVRPDRFIAWRSNGMVPDAKERLSKVLDHVLSRNTAELPDGR